MAQTGYTPISLYYSATGGSAPTSGNLVAGELAINTADGKLFYKDSSGIVQTLATKGTGSIGGATTQVQYNNAGALAGSANFVWDNTNGYLGINKSTPVKVLDIVGTAASISSNTQYAPAFQSVSGYNGSNGGYFQLFKSRGSITSPTAVINGDDLGSLTSFGYDGSSFLQRGWVNFIVDGSVSTNVVPTAIAFVNGSSTATESMRVSSAGDLGVGTNNPSSRIDGYKNVNGDSTVRIQNPNAGSSARSIFLLGNDINGATAGIFLNSSTNTNMSGATSFNIYQSQNAPLGFFTAATERMRIDGSGNVGIGTSSPISKLSVNGYLNSQDSSNNGALYVGQYLNVNGAYGGFEWNNSSGILTVRTQGSYPITFATANTERMRIDSAGKVAIGTLSPSANTVLTSATTTSSIWPLELKGVDYGVVIGLSSSGGNTCYFTTTSGYAGSIYTSTNTTQYLSGSDYRLKEDIAPMTGALETVSKLKPVTYKWKADGSSSQGFVAHELQEVMPLCVSGKKDGTKIEKYEISPAISAEFDADGKVIKEAVEAVMGEREVPEYQGVDTSFLVATLTAAIQEQQAMIEELKAKVAALEAA